MKYIKEIFKIILLFIVSTVIIYFSLTTIKFLFWCNAREIYLFKTNKEFEEITSNLTEYKITGLGQWLVNCADMNDTYSIGNAMWSFIQGEVNIITMKYRDVSLFLGISIAFAYAFNLIENKHKIIKYILIYFIIEIVSLISFYCSRTSLNSSIDTKECMILYIFIFSIMYGIMILFQNKGNIKNFIKEKYNKNK